MNPEKILQSSFIDILFDGKNKAYGAYELRKGYNSRLTLAMLTVPALILVISFFHYAFRAPDTVLVRTISLPDDGDHRFVEPPKPEEPKPLQPAKPPAANKPVATIRYTSFQISAELADSIPTVEDLSREDRLISSITREGIPPVEIAAPAGRDNFPETGTGNIPPKTAEPEIFETADKMPEFPGGREALYRFLSRNLRVPESLEPGEKIRLLVRFYIDLNGKVEGISFENEQGEVFEREVTRVINKMPLWKPGLQGGRPVQVYYRIPIIFQVPE